MKSIEWRERFYPIRVPEKRHMAIKQLCTIINQEQVPQATVTERAGVHKCAIKDWRTRHDPRLADLEAVANVVGYTVRLVPLGDVSDAA